MKALRVVGLWVVLVLGMASSAMAEGFALTEWSAPTALLRVVVP